MAKRVQCRTCGKRFRMDRDHARHVKDTGHKAEPHRMPKPAERTAEPSMADLMVEAEIARACGEPVNDWLADMLP